MQEIPDCSLARQADTSSGAAAGFRVVLFTSMEPQAVVGLLSQMEAELSDVRLVGVVYEPSRSKTFQERCHDVLRGMRTFAYLKFFVGRVLRIIRTMAARAAENLLQFVHADLRWRGDRRCPGLADLSRWCADHDVVLHVTADFHDPASLKTVESLLPDLGVVFGTRILRHSLFSIPAQGSINIHKRKVPDYRGGGPIGLWELLDGQKEIGITVHRVTDQLDGGAILREAVIPIEPFDTLTSLSLKADVIGNDLLIETIAAQANGTFTERAQNGPGRMFRKPSPSDLAAYELRLELTRPRYRPKRGRATWKLLLRILALGPFVVVRNWYRRLRGSFPVVILCHHVVTDRPHPLGIPTALYLEHVRFLQRHYQVLSLPEAVRLLERGPITRPTVVLTLDDGYADNYLNLRAIVQATAVPITVFVCTENMTQQKAFDHDLQNGVSGFLPLTWSQAEILKRHGVHVASHTRSHYDCGSNDLARLRNEIAGSQADLEEHLGDDGNCFAFPWGKPENMSHPALEFARNAYRHVFSAFGGGNFAAASPNRWHFHRELHPNDLWELELTIQSILDFDRPSLEVADFPAPGESPSAEFGASEPHPARAVEAQSVLSVTNI